MEGKWKYLKVVIDELELPYDYRKRIFDCANADLAARVPTVAEVERAFVAAERRHQGAGSLTLRFLFPAGVWQVHDSGGKVWALCSGSRLIPQLDALWPAAPEPAEPEPTIVIGRDGRCVCTCGTKCPLGYTGTMGRCTKAELLRAGIPVIDEADALSEPAPSIPPEHVYRRESKPAEQQYGPHDFQLDIGGKPEYCRYCEEHYDHHRSEMCSENPLPEPKPALTAVDSRKCSVCGNLQMHLAGKHPPAAACDRPECKHCLPPNGCQFGKSRRPGQYCGEYERVAFAE